MGSFKKEEISRCVNLIGNALFDKAKLTHRVEVSSQVHALETHRAKVDVMLMTERRMIQESPYSPRDRLDALTCELSDLDNRIGVSSHHYHQSSREKWIWQSTIRSLPVEGLMKHLHSILSMLVEPDACLRKSGLEAMLRLPRDALLPHLDAIEARIKDIEWMVREVAVRLLGCLGVDAVRPLTDYLLKMEARDPQFYVQKAARDVIDACQLRPPPPPKCRGSPRPPAKRMAMVRISPRRPHTEGGKQRPNVPKLVFTAPPWRTSSSSNRKGSGPCY